MIISIDKDIDRMQEIIEGRCATCQGDLFEPPPDPHSFTDGLSILTIRMSTLMYHEFEPNSKRCFECFRVDPVNHDLVTAFCSPTTET